MMKCSMKGTGRKIRDLILRLITLSSVLSLTACSLLPESLKSVFVRENTPAEVQEEILIPVTRGKIASSMYFVGNLEYNQSSALTWKTSGVIDRVNVKVGDRVRKGDILAVLATDSLPSSVIMAEKTMIDEREKLEDIQSSELARMQAYSDLNAKESALVNAKLEQEALYYPRATKEEMERAWDSLALAHLNFNYAKQDYDYLVSIGEPWTGSEKEITIRRFGRTFRVSGADERAGRERKFEEYVSAYNTYVSAYENYQWISGEPTAVDYAVAEGNVRVAQMEYDKALEEYMSYEVLPREKDVNAVEVSLNNAESSYNQRFIIAQFDGTVSSVSAVKDYYVTRGSDAVRVDDMSRIFIPLDVPELDFSSVASGTKVDISVDAISGKTYSGHLYTIADASEASDNTTAFRALVEVDDPDDRMLAGMTAEITMPVNEKDDALLIPNSAVTYIDSRPYVTVVTGNVRQSVEVRLGIVLDDISEVVSSGLKEGSKVAVNTISREALTQLGLDPADYLESPAGEARPMQQSRPEPAGGNAPEMQPPVSRERPASVPIEASGSGSDREDNSVPDAQAAPVSDGDVQIPETETKPDPSAAGEMDRPAGERPSGDGNDPLPDRRDRQSPAGDTDVENVNEAAQPSRDGNRPPSGRPDAGGPRDNGSRPVPENSGSSVQEKG